MNTLLLLGAAYLLLSPKSAPPTPPGYSAPPLVNAQADGAGLAAAGINAGASVLNTAINAAAKVLGNTNSGGSGSTSIVLPGDK